MKPVSQPQPPLIGGVSRVAPEYRDRSFVEECVNFMPDSTLGLIRRPPSDHIARLQNLPNPAVGEQPLVHSVNRDGIEEYRVVISGGQLRVYDNDTGAERAVILGPGANAYLNSLDGYRAVTAGDVTWIVNRQRTVQKGTSMWPQRAPEAIVFFRQTDYSTTYRLDVDGVKIEYRTPDGSTQGLGGIKTDVAAAELLKRMETALGGQFVLRRLGSGIHLRRANSGQFRVTAEDGTADAGLRIVQGRVQRAEDLPFRAVHGMTVLVEGDPGTGKDDWWAVFDATNRDAGDGLWREAPKPGTIVSLDAASMPHILRRNGPTLETLVRAPAGVVATAGGAPLPLNPPAFSNANLSGGLVVRRCAIPLAAVSTAPREARLTLAVDAFAVPAGMTVAFGVFLSPNGDFATRQQLTFAYRGGSATAVYLRSGESFQEEVSVPLTGIGARPLPVGTTLDVVVELWGTTGATDTTALAAISPRVVASTVSVERINDAYFEATEQYPPGFVVEIRNAAGGALLASYTSPTVQTGAQLATALAAALNGTGGLTVTNPATAAVRVASTVPEVTVTGISPGNLVRLGQLPAGTTAADLIGRTLVNVTTGASGTPTAWNAPFLTVALSGGVRPGVQQDDELAFFATGNYFYFGPARWKTREAGDDVTVPWPSFVGKRIADVFVWQNRLGFLSEDRVILSSSDDYANFFRASAVTLLESDPVDIQSALPEIAWFHSAVPYQNRLWLAAERGLFVLDGDPAITPGTARLTFKAAHAMDRNCKPVVAGDMLLFASASSGSTRLSALRLLDGQSGELVAENLSKNVPKWIDGNPVVLAAAVTQRRAFIVTDKRDFVYVFNWTEGDGGTLAQAAWVKWRFPGSVVHLDTLGGDLGLLTRHSDGVHHARVELDREPFA